MHNKPDFNYFALGYLNAWFEYDEQFHCEWQDLNVLQAATKYYRVARNFKTLPEETNSGRLSLAMRMLASINEIGAARNDAITAVEMLGRQFGQTYGRAGISAASKLLWIRFQRPVIIYDSRARRYLDTAPNYGEFYEAWITSFKNHRKQIDTACEKLASNKIYSLRPNVTQQQVENLCSQLWFKERVFDKYLWFYGGGDEVED